MANLRARPAVTIDERDRKDYFCPPSDMFEDYCNSIAKRYDLLENGLIKHASVHEIDYDIFPQLSTEEKFFYIRTDRTEYYAKSVVLAVGAGNPPSIPKPFPQSGCPNACHAFTSLDQSLGSRLRSKLPSNVLVIGGGLTSAQMTDQAIRRGATKVFHLMRGPLKSNTSSSLSISR